MLGVKKYKILKIQGSLGDTIVEVLLSMTLLTAFLFISWGITNKATQIGINSRKRVEMVNAMKEQAEILKAQYIKDGSKVDSIIKNGAVNIDATTTGLGSDPCDSTGITNNNIFYYSATSNTIVKSVAKKQMPDINNTLWMQYKPGPGADPEYYDFYIRACWQTVGGNQNTDNSQFIVRLNDV